MQSENRASGHQPSQIAEKAYWIRLQRLRALLPALRLRYYGGTYKFDGKSVEHSIDIAWNEVWSGTKQVRTVTREGDRLTLTTPPFPFPH